MAEAENLLTGARYRILLYQSNADTLERCCAAQVLLESTTVRCYL